MSAIKDIALKQFATISKKWQSVTVEKWKDNNGKPIIIIGNINISNILISLFYFSKNFLFIVLATCIILVALTNSASFPYIALKALLSVSE